MYNLTNVSCMDVLFKVNEFLATQDTEKSNLSVEEVAMGFITVANEAMCRPIRALTQVFCCIFNQLVLVP